MDENKRTTISLRLTAAERRNLDALKRYLNENTATRALLHVMRHYPAHHNELQAVRIELEQAKSDRDRLLRAITGAEQARAELVGVAAEIALNQVETSHANPEN